jgi:putative transposase
MADYRRYRVPGGIYFFTIDPLERRAYLPVRYIEPLRGGSEVYASRATILYRRLGRASRVPCFAWVNVAFDSRSSMAASLRALRVHVRSGWICGNGVFGEHTIRDEGDYVRHMKCVHFNPVKYGYVSLVAHWPHSTFHRWLEADAYLRLDVSVDDRRR